MFYSWSKATLSQKSKSSSGFWIPKIGHVTLLVDDVESMLTSHAHATQIELNSLHLMQIMYDCVFAVSIHLATNYNPT